jgi:hypothetical protein
MSGAGRADLFLQPLEVRREGAPAGGSERGSDAAAARPARLCAAKHGPAQYAVKGGKKLGAVAAGIIRIFRSAAASIRLDTLRLRK